VLGDIFDYVANMTDKNNNLYLTPAIRYNKYENEILAYYLNKSRLGDGFQCLPSLLHVIDGLASG
jgi:hypothetical protein